MRSLAFMIASIAATVMAQIPGPDIPSGQGVNIHFTKARPGEMEMLARGGFGFVRMDFVWSGTERNRGVYDFSAYDYLLDDLSKHGIRAIFILDYTNAMYDKDLAPHTPEGREGFAKWAAAAATHFAGKGVLWEMWNEPNLAQFWKPKPNLDDYAQLALTVGKALREAAPNEVFVGPASSSIDMNFLEGCFKAGLLEYWSAVTVHPYRGNNPETAASEYRKLRALIDRYAPAGKQIPIISGEWGYAVNGGTVTEASQASFLARQWLVNVSCDVPLSIWYDWHDDGENPKDPECHFGTVSYAYREGQNDVFAPKPAYLAAQTLTAQLRGYRFNKRLALESPDDWLLLFTKGLDAKLVVWSTRRDPHSVLLPVADTSFSAVTSTGSPVPIISNVQEGIMPPDAVGDEKGVRLTLSDTPEFPFYLTPTRPSAELGLLSNWTRLKPYETVHAPVDYRPELKVTNTTGKPIKVYASEKTTVDLAPGATLDAARTGRISRSVEPVVIRQELHVEGHPVAYQESYVGASNPVIVTAMPAMGGQIPIRIETPASEPVAGTLRMRSPVGEVQDIKTAAAPESVFHVSAGNASGPYTVALELMGKDGAPILEVPARRYVPMPLNLASYNLVPDGDANVASEQTAEVVPAPEGLPAAGVQAMQVAYRFSPGWKFIRMAVNAPALQKIEGQPLALGMWIHGDGGGNSPRMRFVDSTGQCFQPSAPDLNYKGWRYVEFSLKSEGAGRWGGAADGVIHYPIRLDTLFLVDGISRKESGGTIYIAAPTLIYPADSTR